MKYKRYLLYIVGMIIVIFFCNRFDNDIWFILNCGKYVLNNGIPFIDPFTIHEGLEYIMQQWLSSVIFWLIYNKLGYKALLLFTWIISFIIMILYSKLLETITNHKNFSIFMSVFFILFISKNITVRPQMFTYTLLILELLLLELYIKNKNKKYLYLLPIISILEVNLHMSMWLFLFLFLMPYYAEYIFNIIFKKDNFKIKPIIIVSILMLLGGLINPYTYKCYLFIFESYGNSYLNDYILEMKNILYDKSLLILFIISIISLLILYKISNKKKFNIRYLFLYLGCMILFILHVKCMAYYMISYLILFSILFIEDKDINLIDNKIINYILCIILIIVFIISSIYSLNKYSDYNYLGNIVNYIKDNYDISNIKVFSNFEDGGYLEFNNIKTYIDPRAELFLKSMNKKEDIFSEYYNVYYGYTSYDEFIDKYKFDLIVTFYGNKFDDYLINCEHYKLVYYDLDYKTDTVYNLYEWED